MSWCRRLALLALLTTYAVAVGTLLVPNLAPTFRLLLLEPRVAPLGVDRDLKAIHSPHGS